MQFQHLADYLLFLVIHDKFAFGKAKAEGSMAGYPLTIFPFDR